MFLYNWYFTPTSQKTMVAQGTVIGSPKFDDGDEIHTSEIKGLSLVAGALLATTASGRNYTLLPEAIRQCSPADYDKWFYITQTCLEQFSIDAAGFLADCRQKQQTADEKVSQLLSAGDLLLIVAGSTVIRAYFKNETGQLCKPLLYIHLGMFQDSLLIKEGNLDFSYFPEDNRLTPYHLSANIQNLHIYNLGHKPIQIGEVNCPPAKLIQIQACELI